MTQFSMTTEEKRNVILETLAEKIEEQRREINELLNKIDDMAKRDTREIKQLTCYKDYQTRALRNARDTIERLTEDRNKLLREVNQDEEQKGEDNAE